MEKFGGIWWYNIDNGHFGPYYVTIGSVIDIFSYNYIEFI